MVPAALGLGAAVVLGGCSAGQVTQTDTQVAGVNGGQADEGDVSVRDAQFTFPTTGTTYPEGSSAPVQTTVVNSGPQGDRLVEVSSPYAASVSVSGATEIPSDGAVQAYGDQAPGATDSAYAQPGANTDQREVAITLTGLTQDIGPGVTVPVTFTFENNEDLTVQVPIGQDHRPRPDGGSPQPEDAAGAH